MNITPRESTKMKLVEQIYGHETGQNKKLKTRNNQQSKPMDMIPHKSKDVKRSSAYGHNAATIYAHNTAQIYSLEREKTMGITL